LNNEESDNIWGDCDGTQSDPEDDMSRDRTIVSGRWASALRRLMDEQGITQLELAAQAGVDKDTVSNVMRGESSSTATMEKLAQALGVDVSELALTAEQSRILAESRLSGDDLARRISEELSASIGSAGPGNSPEATSLPDSGLAPKRRFSRDE
jgi:transcriptional regulator with XRE-family HTH domain